MHVDGPALKYLCYKCDVFWFIFLFAYKMFNKPKRNFRSRKRDSESDEEDLSDDSKAKDATKSGTLSAAKGGLSLTTKTVTDKGKKNSSELKAVSSANSLLSFVTNEEGTLQIKNVDVDQGWHDI